MTKIKYVNESAPVITYFQSPIVSDPTVSSVRMGTEIQIS